MTQVSDSYLGWSGTRRAAWYEWSVYLKTWRGSVISNFLFPIFYLGSMGIGIGHLVGSHAGLINGHRYLAFVAPGLVATTAMQLAAGESMWPVLGGIKWTKTYQAAIATPLEAKDVITGRLFFVMARLLVTTITYTLVVAAFGALSSWWALLLPLVGLLTGMAFAAPLSAYSCTLENDATFTLVQRFIIVPMFLFSATFYPLSSYPSYLHPVVELIPLYHGVALSRDVAFGEGTLTTIATHLAVLCGLVIIGVYFARRNFEKRLMV